MKNKFKHLFAALLLITLICAFTVSASASEAQITTEEGGEYTEENFFAKTYAKITEYATEILCALTFAGSLVLAFAYKKGLLPLIKGSLVTIGNAVSKINDDTSESAEKGTELEKNISNSLAAAKETVNALTERISELDCDVKKKLEDEDKQSRTCQELRAVMDAQIDMLYGIFMCAALPQYQKDAIGERVAKMKEAIKGNDTAN